ncbi:hypothetical protein [Nocardioides sp. R-C-SC26]|uniref:hypothetical protein n=1 Tax=Nocardioides sp. R-C-SC26 TaxID=2870414 RepID=UPI001E61CB3D|nr:hypothetical protein [Nocardioides sp. R-C-SC26]
MSGVAAARRLRPVLTVAALVATTSLSACGGDPTADYCAEVEARQSALSAAVADGAATGLLSALPELEELAAAAPDDLVDEWAVVTERLGGLQKALSAAGIDDPAGYDPTDPPEGVSAAQVERIRAAASALDTPEMRTAFNAVQQQARDVCKTPLVR